MIRITLPYDENKVLCGFDKGLAMRERLALNHLEKTETALELVIHQDLYTISSSYVHGLVQKYPEKYTLICENKQIQEILNMHLRVLRMRHSMYQKPPTWMQRWKAAKKAFQRGY